MELNHLKYFYEVARHGSFTRAARTLRVSQPSISKIVRQLEVRNDIKLFERGKRGVLLTEEGRTFFEKCGRIFSEVEDLKSQIAYSRDECAGDLAIAASDNFCNYVLPSLFAKFWLDYPKVRIKLFNGTSESIRTELLDGKAELGLFYTPLKDPALSMERLLPVEFAIVCSRKNELLRSGKFDARLLSRAFYVGSRAVDYAKPNPCLKMLDSLGVQPTIGFETNSQETQKRMAHQEWGYGVLPLYMVADELKSGRLVRIKTPKRLEADLFLVRRKGKQLPKPATVFQEYLKGNLMSFLEVK